jgi:hypothetical protein
VAGSILKKNLSGVDHPVPSAPGAGHGERSTVLVAIEPRAYRQAIGRAIGALRPSVDVRLVEPERLLWAEVERLAPQLVICTRAKPSELAQELSWVEFRPYGAEPKVRVCMGDRCWVLQDADLEDLLSLVDEAIGLPRCEAL